MLVVRHYHNTVHNALVTEKSPIMYTSLATNQLKTKTYETSFATQYLLDANECIMNECPSYGQWTNKYNAAVASKKCWFCDYGLGARTFTIGRVNCVFNLSIYITLLWNSSDVYRLSMQATCRGDTGRVCVRVCVCVCVLGVVVIRNTIVASYNEGQQVDQGFDSASGAWLMIGPGFTPRYSVTKQNYDLKHHT